MLVFIIIAVTNGIINIINKMINLQAKHKLGTANGTLINYLEGTMISLLIVLLKGQSKLMDLSLLKAIPIWCFFGGLFGLLSMVLILFGMSKNHISYSTVLVLIGQLGAGLLLDSIVAHKVVPVKIVGIVLVIIGVVIDKYLSDKPMKKTPTSKLIFL